MANMLKEFTATVYILHEGKVLLLFHPKFNKWLPPGGHLEDNESPPEAARREVLEETGLKIEFILQENVSIKESYAQSIERPFMCLLENIPSWKDIPPHQHVDFIYVAKPIDNFLISTNETHDLRWFTLEEVLSFTPGVEIYKDVQQVITHLFSNSLINCS